MSNRPLIAVAGGASDEEASAVTDAIERAGGEPWALSDRSDVDSDEAIRCSGALVLTGSPDLQVEDSGSEIELNLVRAALSVDLPVYGIGRGMQLLNLATGGSSPVPIDGHVADEPEEPGYHHVYISPGSKLAAVVGSGGFVRVNSLHRTGIREAQKSPLLLASAYSLDDGLIEALESPNHRWVIGVQFSPERRMELPPHFDRLFQSLVERAAERLWRSL